MYFVVVHAADENQLRRDLLRDYDDTKYPTDTIVETGIIYKRCPRLDGNTGVLISDVYERYVGSHLTE